MQRLNNSTKALAIVMGAILVVSTIVIPGGTVEAVNWAKPSGSASL